MVTDQSRVRLVCCDLDGTLLGDVAALGRLRRAWDAAAGPDRPLLVFNSARLVPDQRAAIKSERLPVPDYLIAGVGSGIVDVAADRMMTAYSESLAPGWDRSAVDAILAATPGVERQPEEFQEHYKSSWYAHGLEPVGLARIEHALAWAGVRARLIYSSRRDLDVLPEAAGKGRALVWLLNRLGIEPAATLVAGDTGNDIDMMILPGVKRILLANADPDLRKALSGLEAYSSRAPMAGGVLEALRHFGVA